MTAVVKSETSAVKKVNKKEKSQQKELVEKTKGKVDKAYKADKQGNMKMRSLHVILLTVPYGFFEHQLLNYFKQFGTVVRVRVVRNKKTANSRNVAFVAFNNRTVAQIAAEAMDGYLMRGFRIKCKLLDSVPPQIRFGPLIVKQKKVEDLTPFKNALKDYAPRTEKEEHEYSAHRLEVLQKMQEKLTEMGIDYKCEAATLSDDEDQENNVVPAAKPLERPEGRKAPPKVDKSKKKTSLADIVMESEDEDEDEEEDMDEDEEENGVAAEDSDEDEEGDDEEEFEDEDEDEEEESDEEEETVALAQAKGAKKPLNVKPVVVEDEEDEDETDEEEDEDDEDEEEEEEMMAKMVKSLNTTPAKGAVVEEEEDSDEEDEDSDEEEDEEESEDDEEEIPAPKAKTPVSTPKAATPAKKAVTPKAATPAKKAVTPKAATPSVSSSTPKAQTPKQPTPKKTPVQMVTPKNVAAIATPKSKEPTPIAKRVGKRQTPARMARQQAETSTPAKVARKAAGTPKRK